MSRFFFAGIILLLSIHATAAEVDASTGLIIAPGWENVRAHCGGCHSHALVTQQRADRQTWLDMIRWMQDSQNLWQFQAETEAQILDYLADNYPPAPNRRRAPIPLSLMPPSASADQIERSD
jgi:hypothetical protein